MASGSQCWKVQYTLAFCLQKIHQRSLQSPFVHELRILFGCDVNLFTTSSTSSYRAVCWRLSPPQHSSYSQAVPKDLVSVRVNADTESIQCSGNSTFTQSKRRLCFHRRLCLFISRFTHKLLNRFYNIWLKGGTWGDEK